jgi:hypothetical protein
VHKRNENVKWVNNMENSAYYWMLEVNEVKYAVLIFLILAW